MVVPPAIEVPTLETARLRLRAHRADDLSACLALWSDAEVVRYIGGQPSAKDAVWMRMMQYRGHWALTGYGYWLVEERATGAFVGEVGVADFKRDLQPSIEGVPEAGWAIATDKQGRGYATEAVTGALAWVEANLDDPELACIIDPANVASLRVATKLDFRQVAHTTWRDLPTIVFRRPPRRG
ncbi:MAG: GNAT family N-acetyltransferase [Kofleriaceae bacterium]|jgi:RimJ/RimL family protein N-acetyltransferase|nr:GNAT family N-acetyltransferase [Kofleriaceae bacterium]MBP9168622.1 GNAT family N-acetyltransferase [Kofleriaceae bacterium]MBP9857504.1 GNAT family N-acetyltransferase [Kofleriaceae bacterium]